MIGGIEIRLPTRGVTAPLEVAVRAIGQEWPDAVFENGISGERYDEFGQIPFGSIEEIFVYRDRDSADVWEAHGAIPAVHNTMIHIISDDGLLTLVVDRRDAAMEAILGAVAAVLESSKSATDQCSKDFIHGGFAGRDAT
jgi:hypothetical protein